MTVCWCLTCLALLPKTNSMASMTFDFPLPFGPTTDEKHCIKEIASWGCRSRKHVSCAGFSCKMCIVIVMAWLVNCSSKLQAVADFKNNWMSSILKHPNTGLAHMHASILLRSKLMFKLKYSPLTVLAYDWYRVLSKSMPAEISVSPKKYLMKGTDSLSSCIALEIFQEHLGNN